MAKKKSPNPILKALKDATANEALAVEFLEKQRWADEPYCPLCGVFDTYQMRSADGQRNKDFRWRCRGCRGMFTVRTRTVFEESRLPLRVWVYAFWKACSSKKGISALQLSREMEITHKSALFVLRRIRHGVGDVGPLPKLSGTVEADETYVGGKPRNKGPHNIRGRGTARIPVAAVVERGGDVRFKVMPRVTVANLAAAILENVDASSRLITDDLNLYKHVGRFFEGGHETVKHSEGEYQRKGTDIHSNTVEGVFSLVKRGIYGTFHSVSKKHLANYLDEFAFRHNTRKMNDGERVACAIRKVEGKRIEYRESVEAPPWHSQ
ncbi:MAG: IS1595 family transposase [Thermoanaerobaculia bacterium]